MCHYEKVNEEVREEEKLSLIEYPLYYIALLSALAFIIGAYPLKVLRDILLHKNKARDIDNFTNWS